MTETVQEKLKLLADSPGVYLMKDSGGHIIYVGKAVVLKNRVRQYFQNNSHHSPKVRAMVAKIADFETILTGSEIEALILECNLIKKYRPRYNICLKDDKTYPYVKVTLGERFPRVLLTRRLLRDGGKYFGPYTNVGAVHESLKLLRKLFPLRTCKRLNADRPCLEHHIGRCLAPCVGKIAEKEYNELVQAVIYFLEGKTEGVERILQQQMLQAADEMHFEMAAKLRDQLLAVRKVAEKQNIVSASGDEDVLGLARSELGVCVQIFFIREGKMLGREYFMLNGSESESDADLLRAFLEQYYHRAAYIPKQVLIPFALEDKDLLEGWLTGQKGSKVEITEPQRGMKHELVALARQNAEKYLADEAAKLREANAQTDGAVQELGRYLSLKNPPYRMECFDISHIQGSETVASMVVFEGGVPNKNAYRRFKIKSAEGKPDDFLSMREVTQRRYGDAKVDEMPDLIIIDGGLGQLSSALQIIRGAGHKDVPVVGLAKQFELVFVEGTSEPVVLPRQSQALYLIQRIRDEAHRFAITYHRSLRRKRNMVSVLDNIVGIGPARRQALWNYFGNLAKIKEASVEELCRAQGMNLPAAQAVYNFFAAKREMSK